MTLLTDKIRQELGRLCRQYQVRQLDVFGSAAGDAFDPEVSDIDLIVTFNDLDSSRRADAYFGLLEELQVLFGRPVDLVVESAVVNPYFRQSMDATRKSIYAA